MTLSMQRSDHSGLTPQHIGDRFAIRELVDAYAHCADRRDVEGQMSLFTANTEFLWAPSRSGLLLARDRRANSLRVCREGKSLSAHANAALRAWIMRQESLQRRELRGDPR
jgi:hypothetical protein